ncbi:MAG: thioesterase family protein [Chitinophagaceae bacterium]|nr:thioesterase family protein [Polaromonas sp.]
MMLHPFDHALHLEPAGSAQPHAFVGATSPAYWNMIGPFGGLTAATALHAVQLHPELLGEPVALTVNFVSAIRAGPYAITATPVRTNRSTQHWVISLNQPNDDGATEVAMTATAMTALRRDTWQANDMPMPSLPPPSAVPRDLRPAPLAWLAQYDMRFMQGSIPEVWDGRVAADSPSQATSSTVSQLWLGDDQPRALDFASLTAKADVFYPRIWLRRATQVAAGTVSMSTYFHASAQQLRAAGTGYVLAQAQAQAYRHGFFDQSAQLWGEDGTLLATSTQLVYYKE